MILIREDLSEKLPCTTSLFLDLTTFYNKDIFNVLIQVQESVYIRDKNLMEFPINKLYFLVDYLTREDDVKFISYVNKCCSGNIRCCEKNFKVMPYKHQIDAINYGLNKDSWMLLDDCGLGKTVSMIYLAEELKRLEGLEHCFIVCGVNSLKYNWASEIEKFSKLSCTILGQTVTKTGKKKILSVPERLNQLKEKIDEFFIITNVEVLQHKDFSKYYKTSKNKIDLIVLDEAHHLKNPSSISAKTLLKLKAKRKIALTGTVIMNNPENSFVPLKWTDNVHSTYSEFKHMFNVYGGFGGVQVIGYKNLDLLQNLISSCSLRRRKDEVLDLPDKTYIIDYVEMAKEQQCLYDKVVDGIAAELDLLDHKPNILEELAINLRLRQITAYPGILSSDVQQSAKLDRLYDLVSEITSQGDKVLVFNTFKGSAKEEFNRLEEFGPLLCTGDQSDEEISFNKKLFETDDSKKVMIATWQKMGTGHTLTSANYCIFVDTPWTDADFQQASDRIYRIGQNKKVTIISLVTKDSYDERVLDILQNKRVLSSYLIDKEESDSLNIFNE
ncbi:MAG: DEAD/DEAH box helicase [Methanobrevibacter sp.]|nr:DEAD/DEAH box helicase [Methanobrevibacter sp.]